MRRILIISIGLLNFYSLYAIQTLNAVIGDEGWKSFNVAKQELTEKEKIAAHLQFVEEKLRNSMPEGLSPEQKMNRLRLLDNLHAYWSNGNFPMNENSPFEREPTFIDCRGNICAVGYLIERSAGMEMAEHVNGKFHNKYISEMQDAALEMWMEENGVSATDCAMIQPTYGGSSGPSLKGYPDDSLVPLLTRNMKYNGKADSCTIVFQVNQKGKMFNSSVLSGNEELGNAALKYMKKLKYVPYSSWSMYGTISMINPCDIGRITGYEGSVVSIKKEWFIPRMFRKMRCGFRKLFPKKQKPYEPVVRLTICYGMELPKSNNIAGDHSPIIIQLKNDTLKNNNPQQNFKIRGTITEARTGEAVLFAIVSVYSDSGKLISSVQTDINGYYSLNVSSGNCKNFRIETNNIGFRKTIITNIFPYDQILNIQMESEIMLIDETSCSGLPCLGTIYIKPFLKI